MPDSFEEHVGLMYDLLAVAYQADVTRVFTFMLSRELSQRTYPQHRRHRAAPLRVASRQRRAEDRAERQGQHLSHATLFAKFLEKLRSTPDGDGSVLDHSLIFYGGGMGNPNGTPAIRCRWSAVGGGVGKGHRHIQLTPRTPVGNLWLASPNQFGSRIETLRRQQRPRRGFFA